MLDFIPARIVVAALSYFGFFFLYMTRFNMSVMIVDMVKEPLDCEAKALPGGEGENQTVQDATSGNCSHPISNKGGSELEWTADMRGIILASFFYGYAILQIVGGRLAEVFGTKIIFGIAVVGPGILTFFIPLAARASPWLLVALRVTQGLVQGMSFPAMHVLLSHWIPPVERSRYVGAIYLASTFSLVVTMPLVGAIIDHMSWEAAAYVTGALPTLWGIAWFWLMYDKPYLHPRIKEEERKYIEISIAKAGTLENKKLKVPAKDICKSWAFYAIVICDCGNMYGMTTFTTLLPLYLKWAFSLNLAKSGLLSSLPFLLRYFGGITSSILADWLIANKKLSVQKTRKYFSSVAMFGPAFFFVLMIYAGETLERFVAFSCCAMFLNGSIAASQLVNHTDIAPNFAGTLFGISNTMASITSSISAVAAGEILQRLEGQRWDVVFWVAIPYYVLTEVFYLGFAKGSPEPWNYPKEDQQTPSKETNAEEA